MAAGAGSLIVIKTLHLELSRDLHEWLVSAEEFITLVWLYSVKVYQNLLHTFVYVVLL